jgi:hypothetical protein
MMNAAFVHLTVNHIPVIGIPVGTLLLVWGLARRSQDLSRAALVIWIGVVLCSFVAWKSGGSAGHLIRGWPGIERRTVHEHAEAADWAVRSATVLGILSLVGLWLTRNSKAVPKAMSALLILGGFGLSGWFAYVSHLGGLIRHPEIAPGFVSPTPSPFK